MGILSKLKHYAKKLLGKVSEEQIKEVVKEVKVKAPRSTGIKGLTKKKAPKKGKKKTKK